MLFDAIDMRWDWPVDANYHEARAFAAWRTEADGASVHYRLITEAEHNLLRNSRDRVDAHLHTKAGSAQAAAAAAEPGRRAGANERVSPDLAMELSGANATARDAASGAGGFNVQLAHSSQNPVTELPPCEWACVRLVGWLVGGAVAGGSGFTSGRMGARRSGVGRAWRG